MGTLAKVAKVVDSCRIYERHLSHTDDSNLCSRLLHLLKLLETAGKSEEERSVDLIDLDSCRNIQTVGIFHSGLLWILSCSNEVLLKHLHLRGLHHTTHEEHDCKDDSHLDGHSKVNDHSEEECEQQHCHVRLVTTEEIFECPPLTHVVCNLNEDRRKA